MSPYIKERADEIVRLLPADDQQVLREFMDAQAQQERDAARRRHDGPHWIWPALGLLLLSAILAPAVHGAVGCFRDEAMSVQRECCHAGEAARAAFEAVCPLVQP